MGTPRAIRSLIFAVPTTFMPGLIAGLVFTTALPLDFPLVLLIFSLPAILFLPYVSFRIWKLSVDPLGFILARVKATKAEQRLVEIANSAASSVGIEAPKTPKIFVGQGIVYPLSLGVHEEEAACILPENSVKLEAEELEGVLAHEMWHVKLDVEAIYVEYVANYLSVKFLQASIVSGVVMASFLALALSDPSLRTIFAIDPIPVFVLVFLAVLVNFVAGGVYFLSTSALLTVQGLPSFTLLMYYREFIADLLAAAKTRKPAALKRALLRLTASSLRNMPRMELGEKPASGVEVDLQVFFEKLGLQRKDRLFELETAYPAISKRYRFLGLADRLVNGHVKLKLNWKFHSRFVYAISAKLVAPVDKSVRDSFLRYVETREDFNLLECAREINARLSDTAVVLLGLLHIGVLEVT